MVDLVATFLQSLHPEEVRPAVSMILGQPLPKQNRMLEVNWSTLRLLIKRLTSVSWSHFVNTLSQTGDVGSAIRAIFQASKIRRQAQLFKKPLTILDVEQIFATIAETSGRGSRERKERLVETLLSQASPLEVKYIVKIMLGEMRIGFSEGLMEMAVAKAFNLDLQTVQTASMLVGNVSGVASIAKSNGSEGLIKLEFEVFRPTKPMMAQMAENVKEVLREVAGVMAFEYKLDGARVQIHKAGKKVRVYSRRLTDVTESLPEIMRIVQRQVKANQAILDGEAIAVSKENGRPLPFQYLMRRFRRIHKIGTMIEEIPIELQLFDVIYVNGKSLLDIPYCERRKKMREIIGDIRLTKQIITSSEREAREFLEEALHSGHEGLIAKKIDSPYSPRIRGKYWFKIKRTLEALDLVIVAAEWGYGRRHNWLSDYHLAARDAETDKLIVIGKTFKGLNDQEIAEMTQRLQKLSIQEDLRRVKVIPKIVVEVAYNEIQKSSKYKSGMALRFARIKRIRADKSPEDVDTIQHVREIFEKQYEKKAKY